MNNVVQVVERTGNWTTTFNLDQFRRVAVRRSARTGELSGGKGRHGSEVRRQLSMETDNGGLDSAAGHLPGLDLATQTLYVSTAGRKLSSTYSRSHLRNHHQITEKNPARPVCSVSLVLLDDLLRIKPLAQMHKCPHDIRELPMRYLCCLTQDNAKATTCQMVRSKLCPLSKSQLASDPSVHDPASSSPSLLPPFNLFYILLLS